MTKEYFYEWL